MFLKRHYEKEIMDDFSITDERIDAALEELNVINKYLGGNSVSREGLNALAPGDSKKKIKILDIGAGGSDLFYKLKRDFPKLEWTSVDLNIQACRFEKKRDKNNSVVCANALRLPFKNNSFDIVHASLFLHHFKEDDISVLITDFNRICRHGIVINDLRRNIIALSGIKLLTLIFSKSKMVKNDGPLSVKRGFLRKELICIMNHNKFSKYVIKRKWAFRWLIYAFK